MKFIRSLAVIFLLFIVPLGSWYFLQRGLDWRIDKRVLLEPKISLEEILSAPDVINTYKYKTTLLQLDELDQQKESVVKDQFRDANTFQWIHSPTDVNTSHRLLEGSDYLLIDTALQVRRIYRGESDSIFAHMVEDISLIIPRKKELDIKMKNSKTNE